MFSAITRQIVAAALAEDIGPGDITSRVTVTPHTPATGRFLARQDGVLAGVLAAEECFRQVDPAVRFVARKQDGDDFAPNETLITVEGNARSLLAAERVSLNFLQRMSGIATLTREYVRAVQGTGARIVDTRKTTPGLRLLEKSAVRAGGGRNHRFGLYDGVLIKDNHVAVAGGVIPAVNAAREGAPATLRIEVECDTLAQVEEALEAGADIIMLDNMSCEQMRVAVKRIAGRAIVEASGGVNLQTVAEIAGTGVDIISVGKLTHSAPALDISLEITTLPS